MSIEVEHRGWWFSVNSSEQLRSNGSLSFKPIDICCKKDWGMVEGKFILHG